MLRLFQGVLLCVSLLFLLSAADSAQAQGILLRGIGAVNDSMAGTAIATPLDAAGAIYANPASISGLKECQIGFDLGVILPNSTVTSEFEGMPITWGTAKSDAGQLPAPTMSLVYRNCPHSRFTFGLAIAGVGGAASLYTAPTPVQIGTGAPPTNPILSGKARAANVQIFEILPTVSYRATNRLSLGISPVIGLASLSINPMPLGMPAGAPIDNYGTRYTWGGGFNLGAYYDLSCNWKTGFTFKSPVWTKPMEFIGTDATGAPQNPEFAINLPMSLGWGVSYSGIKRTIIGVDVRYMDYEHTRGFQGIMDENGIVDGLGWDSVWVVSTGVQHTINDYLKVRAGYCYNTNPIPSESQFANVGSPLIMQHVLGLGCTVTLPKDVDAHLAWTHAFQAERSGTVNVPPGVIKVTNTAYADTLIAGVTKRF